jgi:hypothetical protein
VRTEVTISTSMTESPTLRPRRSPRRDSSPRRSWLATFLLLNLLPLGALGVTGVLWAQGKIQLRELPKGLTSNLIGFGVGVTALALVASLSLPVAHRSTKALERAWREGFQVLSGKLLGSRVGCFLRIPFVALGWILAWLSRAVLIGLSFALIAVCIVFLVRVFVPDFAEPLASRLLAIGR